MAANKGEWSELYAFLKIISERSVPAADSKLASSSDKIYNFIALYRNDNGEATEYSLRRENQLDILNQTGKLLKTINLNELGQKTQSIFEKIKNTSGSSFRIEEAERIMDDYLITKVKAKSSNKTDLDAAILDPVSNDTQNLGFSIKSQVGSAPTLLNASSQTNFIYTVNGFHGDIKYINSLENTRDRLNALIEADASILFEDLESINFKRNLRLIDSNYSKVLAMMLLDHYAGKTSKVIDLAELVAVSNQYGFDLTEISYKTKNFLRAVALGMVPSKPWDTYLSTYGGYIIVKSDGNLVCYHLYNDDDFKDYLYNNTKFESPSRTRHNYAKVYEEDGALRIKLNLQIRFSD